MTKEEWKKVEEDLKSPFRTVRLNCDGYKLSLALVRISTYQMGICPYIDGKIKGEWLLKDCEERRRFFDRGERSILTAKGKKEYAKLSKKRQKELHEKYFYDVYKPYWTSFRRLKKHLMENNESIELIKEG